VVIPDLLLPESPLSLAHELEQDWLPHHEALTKALKDVVLFCALTSQIKLRRYQEVVAQAVVNSVVRRLGHSFVVLFPRQSGKNELQAQLETYLLLLYSELEGEIVKVSPTWKPQSLNAMRRLERVLNRNWLTQKLWKKEQGYIYRVGGARIYFLSGSPTTNVVGATASLLLECDEAQDVLIEKWDKEFNPMAASTNATRLFWGTAWTSQTLLARQKHLAVEEELRDGQRRLFQIDAGAVAAEVPEYGKFVEGEIRRLGRTHPSVRTQFFSEEVDAETGMFPQGRIALMQGTQPRRRTPQPGRVYAFLLDVGGEEADCDQDRRSPEGRATNQHDPAHPETNHRDAVGRATNQHDPTALTIVEVDLSGLADGLLQAPVYRVSDRVMWTAEPHSSLYGRLKALVELWTPRWVVIDATGLGAGLASFLERTFPGQVLRFLFSQASKSKLGWDFLAIVDTRRFLDWQPEPGVIDERTLFLRQLQACELEVLPGNERKLKWGVPEGRRDPGSGEFLHDDLVLSAALCARLEELPWGTAQSVVVRAPDVLEGMRDAF
jgi:hypothetical protein